MDSQKKQLTTEVSNQAIDQTLKKSIDDACVKACAAIAPAWPLDRAIAVNPYWQRVKFKLRYVAARMAVLGKVSIFPSRDYISSLWESGRIQPNDLKCAVNQISGGQNLSLSLEDCINALSSPLNLPQLPLLIDLLDDDPLKHTRLSWREAITHQVSQVCATYFDLDQADWHPEQKISLYAFWRDTLTHDHGIGVLMGVPDLGKRLKNLPMTAHEAEYWVMKKLGLPESVWADYLESVLLTVNGWASWCAYLNWEANLQGTSDPNLRELLAIRLAWGVILLECKDELSAKNAFDLLKSEWSHADHLFSQAEQQLLIDEVWQIALEIGYQRELGLSLSQDDSIQSPEKPIVQAAFCIDVRSERIRRALEELDPTIHTTGYAGFFGLPIAYSPLGTELSRPQLPGLLAPQIEVEEHIVHANQKVSVAENNSVIESRHLNFSLNSQWAFGSRWPSAAFSFVEAAGVGYLAKLKEWIKPDNKTRQNADRSGIKKRDQHLIRPFFSEVSPEKRVLMASQILNSMGIDKNIAPLVLLVGHGSQSANNAHASTLDCGACCGQSGEVNARLLANLLNDSSVRDGLKNHGIDIPHETFFVAALHNTTTDEVEFFDTDLLPSQKVNVLNKVASTFNQAGDRVRRERSADLGVSSTLDKDALLSTFRQRANDGAQTRPELGLAGNAAFVIADRSRTKGSLLDGRVFMHEYNPQSDKDGSLLEQLMTAPMLVTHWINWQYHASSVDQARMGAGNKVLHNVVGGHIGVFEGNGGDLRIGLSKQSLHNGERWVHEPLRLTVVIDASKNIIENIVSKHLVLSQLVDNGWLHLWCFDELGLMQYNQGEWQLLNLQ